MLSTDRGLASAAGALAVAATLTLLVNPIGATTSTASSAASGAEGNASRRGPETLMLALPFEGAHSRLIDHGKKGPGPGDMYLGTGQPILDNDTGHRVGSGDSVELIISPRHDGTVASHSTLRLAGGHVDLAGVVRHTDAPFRVPVVGGTGRYLGVKGQMTLVREDEHRKVSVVKLELTR